jgi:hypothetical protein
MLQPRFDDQPMVVLFFVMFLIMSKFFMMPLLIAVMLEHMAQGIDDN